MSTKASVGVGFGLFSTNAAAAYSSLAESIDSSEEYSQDIKTEKVTFNKGFLQIFQKTVTQINIDGQTATMTKIEWTDSVPVDKPWSPEKRREESIAHMKFEFGEGANKNRFTEIVCKKKIKWKESNKTPILDNEETDDGYSCWNPVGGSILSSIEDLNKDGNFKSYTFSGDDGVLDSPNDYQLMWTLNTENDDIIGAYWQPICNAGYRALGHLCKAGEEKPSRESMKCVREDLTEPCGKTATDTGDTSFKSEDKLVQGLFTAEPYCDGVCDVQAYCLKGQH